MDFAILFWFYKDVEVCENRLRILRYYNPDVPIFGLFGGDVGKVAEYERLNAYFDDMFVFDQARDSHWKWLNGDLMITEWFRRRGHSIRWDTLVIVQWDMLFYGHLKKVFNGLQKGEMLLSGLRPIGEVEPRWTWVNPVNPDLFNEYRDFISHVRKRYGFHDEPLCCLFIVACFPREFLDKYSEIDSPELGFLEYKIPVYGQIFGIPFSTRNSFDPWWDDLEERKANTTLAAAGREIDWKVICLNLFTYNGKRVFHPYREIAPISRMAWCVACLIKPFQKMMHIVRRIVFRQV